MSEPGRLCRPRRIADRLQAGFRRSIGSLHREATDRLIEPSPGLEVVIRVQFIAPDETTSYLVPATMLSPPSRVLLKPPDGSTRRIQPLCSQHRPAFRLAC